MASSELTTSSKGKQFGHALLSDFLFDPKYLNLNHGSYGTYPKAIRTVLHHYQEAHELRPDQFIRYAYKEELDKSRAAIARFLNAPVDTVVYVQNATTGINTVLRNLVFEKGDKIVYFDTIYGACERSVAYITETTPAESVKIEYTYPVSDEWLVGEFRRVVEREQKVGFNVRVAIFDTVVSLPGVRMPFEALTKACRELGVLSCVDAAHGVGHLELDMEALDPDFLVSNCHKWLFVPRGCAVFYVPFRNQSLIRSTLPTSHGFQPSTQSGAKFLNPLPPSSKPAFIQNFEFVGTVDGSPYLTLPAAIAYRESLGGEKAILKYCHDLAREAGDLTASILGTKVLENAEGTLGDCCLRTVQLPLKYADVVRVADGNKAVGALVVAWLQVALVKEYDTFMSMVFYDDSWWVRLSSQVYLEIGDFEWAAKILKGLCGRVMKGEFLEVQKAKL